MAGYTSEEAQTLEEIRADVLSRPNHYEEGKRLLVSRYSPGRIHDRAKQDWIAQRKFLKEQGLKGKALTSMLPDKPGSASWSHGACLSHALSELRNVMSGPSSQAEAKAVLLLAVMMRFTDADRMHPVLDVFGPWGTNEKGQATTLDRWVGQLLLYGESELRDWMRNVGLAWLRIREPGAVIVASSHIQSKQHEPGDSESFTIADLRKMIGCSTNTLRRYTIEADVPRPTRGQRNYRYPLAVVRQILKHVAKSAGEEGLRESSRQALSRLEKSPKDHQKITISPLNHQELEQ